MIGDDLVGRAKSARKRLDDPRFRRARRSTVEILFGDSAGLTLFLAILAFFVVIWRAGSFFNDVGLFVPQLEAMAEGRLSLGPPSRELGVYPGMHYVDGQVYGRNYGEVALALPVYWALDLLGMAAFQWLVVVGWSGLVAAVAVRVADHYDRRRFGFLVGGTAALAALVANVATFRSTFEGQTAIVALQVTTMLVAAFTGVLLYRIVARQSGRKLGVLAGAVAVLATPVGFWATIPKRHAFTATLVVVALYGLVRSRGDLDSSRLGQAGFRAIAYASAGLLAWIHAPEGFTLLLALVIVDLPTAPRNDGRTLAIVGGAFALSLVPMLATNVLISGNPFDPPRFLPTYTGIESVPADQLPDPGTETPAPGGETPGEATPGSQGTPGGEGSGKSAPQSPSSDGGSATGPPFGLSVDDLIPSTLMALLQRGVFRYFYGLEAALTYPDRLVTIFFRWESRGYTPRNIFFGGGTNLSVLAAAPVIAVIFVAPVVRGVESIRARTQPAIRRLDPADLFALVAAVLFVTLFIHDLPVRVQVTVRYLHPLYPLLVYAVFRQSWVQTVLTDHTKHALWGYEATVLFGTPLAITGLLLTSLSKGDVFQIFQSVALVGAGLLVVAGLAGAVSATGGGASALAMRGKQASALAFGLAAGLVTVFLLVTALVVMHYGPSALPFVETATGEIRFAILRYG